MSEVNHASRSHALLSASSAHRWLECPGSATASLLYPEEEATEYALEGTRAHEVAECIASDKDLPDKDGYTVEMVRYANGYKEYIEGLKTSDDDTLLFEQRVDFSPWVPEGFGTCDCILLSGDTLRIIDYKYGIGVPVEAQDNPQLKLYALGAINDYGIVMDDLKYVETHIYQPRINNISSARYEVEAVMKWAADTVAPIAKKASSGKGTYKAGTWCKFCPHAAKCRELTKVCMAKVQDKDLKAKVPVLAPFELEEILTLEPLITLWIKRVKSAALEAVLNGEDVPGFKAVEGRGSRGWSDEKKVEEALKDKGYLPEEYLKVELLSPAALESALGKKAVNEAVGDLIERTEGNPQLAPITDKRPAINKLTQAQEDFN